MSDLEHVYPKKNGLEKEMQLFNDTVTRVQEETKLDNTLSDDMKDMILDALGSAEFGEFKQNMLDASTTYEHIPSTETKIRRFLADKIDKIFLSVDPGERETVFQFTKRIIALSKGE